MPAREAPPRPPRPLGVHVPSARCPLRGLPAGGAPAREAEGNLQELGGKNGREARRASPPKKLFLFLYLLPSQGASPPLSMFPAAQGLLPVSVPSSWSPQDNPRVLKAPLWALGSL